MTISTTSNKAQWQGNGSTTVFSFNFEIDSASEATLQYVDANGNISTIASASYSIAGLGNANGGTLTYPVSGSPIASGTSLTLLRTVPLQQLTDLVNQSNYYPDAVEGALDYGMKATQQIQEEIGRQLTFPATDISPTATLPSAAQRAGMFLAFDANGNPTTATQATTAGIPITDYAGRLGRVVDSIANLAGLNPSTYTRAIATGYYAAGDGPGASYYYSASTSQSLANAGTIVASTYPGSTGCWLMIVGNSISPKQFGARANGTDDSSFWNAMLKWVWTLTKSRNLFDGTPNLGNFVVDGGGAEYSIGNIVQPPTTGGGGVVIQNGMMTAISPLASNPILLVSSGTAGYQNLTIRDFEFNGANNKGLTAISLVKLYNCHNVTVDNCWFCGFGNGAYGFYSDALSNDIRITTSYFQQYVAGEHDNIHDKTGTACYFAGPDNYFCDNIVAAAGTGLVCNSNTTASRCHYYGIDNWAIDTQTYNAQYCTIEDSYFDQSSIRLVGPYLTRVKNNRFIALNRGCAIQLEPQSNGWSLSNLLIQGNDYTGLGGSWNGATTTGNITPSATSGNITITDTAADFSTATWNNPSGAFISGNGGLAVITGVISSTQVSATTLVAFSNTNQIASGSWSVEQADIFKYNGGTNGAFGADAASFITNPNNNGGVIDAMTNSRVFTPSLVGSSGTSNHTYTKQVGNYRVIDGICYWHAHIVIGTKDSGMGGNCSIQGLPFTSSNISGFNAPATVGIVSNMTLSTGYTQFAGYVGSNSNVCTPIMLGSGVGQATLPASGVAASNAEIEISGWFPVY